jgi:hypothetical protein
MDKRKQVVATNSKIIGFSNKLTRAVIAEIEETLEDAEKVVKEYVPARFVNKTLTLIENALEKEGLEVAFDKKVTRQALNKTASEKVEESELKELVNEIVEAVVDEIEEILEDADEVMDEKQKEIASCDEEKFEVESKLKSIVERKLHAKGVYVRFSRTASKRKTIVEKIREAARKK